MPNDPRRRQRQNPSPPPAPVAPPGPPASPLPRKEPAMRRWPHPVQQTPDREETPEVRYIRCALAYQNQMLADIKSLLETIAQNTAPPDCEERNDAEKKES